jgi:hypothetical protein
VTAFVLSLEFVRTGRPEGRVSKVNMGQSVGEGKKAVKRVPEMADDRTIHKEPIDH